MTKWVEARVIRVADAKSAAKFLYENIIVRFLGVGNYQIEMEKNIEVTLISSSDDEYASSATNRTEGVTTQHPIAISILHLASNFAITSKLQKMLEICESPVQVDEMPKNIQWQYGIRISTIKFDRHGRHAKILRLSQLGKIYNFHNTRFSRDCESVAMWWWV
ncbi:hypothetical protein O6H91_13G027600 [Diphasiastrum complanatum]|uniref:Uncharacterized protein n=1 Tax=Diphasiastrum complanatum TaxID=34168 RepID=A0ACC2BTV7_DIPCM|nr:hypothetical protein O6H91_13G027600 [Diphasiastrum complanatum]